MVASVVTGAVLKLVSVRPTLQLRVRSLSENFHLVKPAELKPFDVAEEFRRHYSHRALLAQSSSSPQFEFYVLCLFGNTILWLSPAASDRGQAQLFKTVSVIIFPTDFEFIKNLLLFVPYSNLSTLPCLSAHLPLLIRTLLLVCRSGPSVPKTRENRPPKEPFFLSSSFRSRLSL